MNSWKAWRESGSVIPTCIRNYFISTMHCIANAQRYLDTEGLREKFRWDQKKSIRRREVASDLAWSALSALRCRNWSSMLHLGQAYIVVN